MRAKLVLVVSFCCLLALETAFSQGKIVYLNGKEKRFHQAELKGDFIVYKPDTSSRSRRSDKYNVFSIVRDNGVEEMIYDPDTLVTDDPSITEVRDYIRGEQLASRVYKTPWNLVGGIASGMAGSIAGFYGLPAPLIYATIVGRFDPNLPKDEQMNNYSESFVAGYQRKSRNIKIKNSLIGGGIGFAVGITTLVFLLKDDE